MYDGDLIVSLDDVFVAADSMIVNVHEAGAHDVGGDDFCRAVCTGVFL